MYYIPLNWEVGHIVCTRASSHLSCLTTLQQNSCMTVHVYSMLDDPHDTDSFHTDLIVSLRSFAVHENRGNRFH